MLQCHLVVCVCEVSYLECLPSQIQQNTNETEPMSSIGYTLISYQKNYHGLLD